MAKMLLIVDFPNVIFEGSGQVSPQLVGQTEQFEETASGIAGTTLSSVRLSRNAWLFDAKNSWHFLQPMIDSAKSCKLSYSIHLIEGDVTQMTKPPI